MVKLWLMLQNLHGLTIVTMFFGFICSKAMVNFRKVFFPAGVVL